MKLAKINPIVTVAPKKAWASYWSSSSTISVVKWTEAGAIRA